MWECTICRNEISSSTDQDTRYRRCDACDVTVHEHCFMALLGFEDLLCDDLKPGRRAAQRRTRDGWVAAT